MSEGQKEGFLHKSYHVLFVLYAPIALVSIVVNLFSEQHVPYLYSMAFLGAGLSVVLAGLMWWKFLKHRSIIRYEREAGLPYIIRHQFMLMYLPIAFSSMGVCAYYVYDKYVLMLEELTADFPTKITVLMPVTDTLGSELEDVKQVNLALGSLMTSHPELSERYHIVLKNHKNAYNEDLLHYVLKQSSKGNRYFVCTYSQVCGQLITEVKKLAKDGEKSLPIIVTTLASSMNLPLHEGLAYRFYPRNREVANALAGFATREGVKTASFIAADDDYGRNAAKEFSDAWHALGGVMAEGIYLDPVLTQDVAGARILEYFGEGSKPEAIFVAHYQSINSALNPLSQNAKLLLGINYQYHLVDELRGLGAVMDNVAVALPSYKLNANQLVNTAGLFTYVTIKKLIDVDLKLKADGQEDFHSYWWQVGDPAYLAFERDGNVDYRVKVSATSYQASIYGSYEAQAPGRVRGRGQD